MRHPHYAATPAGSGRISFAGHSPEVQSTEQTRSLDGTPSAPSTRTEQGLECTFSRGYAKNPMKQSNKGFDYSYNAQAVVDGEYQIIVAAEVTPAANDKLQAVPMGRAALENLEAAGIERPTAADGTAVPIPNTADTGYFSGEAIRGLEQMGLDPYIAVERQKHHEAASESEPTTAASKAGVKEAMRQKLGTATGKALYAARKRIVEPVFGQTKGARSIRGFLLRCLEKVVTEWQLICLTHNLLKIWRHTCGAEAATGG
jgi:hypothetical protein